MSSHATTEYRYEKLTWPEINDAVAARQVCILPCGAVEQHGHHLPLDVDLVCPGGIARGCGETMPEKVLVLPTIAYGYTGHVMDFPGTINTNYETFIRQRDRRHSLAGLPRVQEDHPAQRPRFEHAQSRPGRPPNQPRDRRRVCAGGVVEPADRRQGVPAGLAGEQVPRRLLARRENSRRRCTSTWPKTTSARTSIKSGTIKMNDEDNDFNWVDLFAAGPASLISWTSSYSETGVLGDAEKGTRREGTGGPGKKPSDNCAGFVDYFQ